MLLELAVASESDFIVTCNVRHFVGVEKFGIRALRPREFLEHIGAPREAGASIPCTCEKLLSCAGSRSGGRSESRFFDVPIGAIP
jgi:hypothetical protein